MFLRINASASEMFCIDFSTFLRIFCLKRDVPMRTRTNQLLILYSMVIFHVIPTSAMKIIENESLA